MDDDRPIAAALTRGFRSLAEALAAHGFVPLAARGLDPVAAVVRELDGDFRILEGGRPVAVLSQREQDMRTRAARAAEAVERCPYRDFLAAVIARPADDAPRLVMADRLDELGEAGRDDRLTAWAELIRLGCEKYRAPAVAGAGYFEALAARIAGARRRARKLYLGRLAGTERFWPQAFERGWPSEIRFASLAHAIRWTKAVAAWLPVDRIWSSLDPWTNSQGNPVWGEAAEGYQWWSPAANPTGLVPRGVFRYLGPPAGSGLGWGANEMRLAARPPVLRRSEDGSGRRYFIYRTEQDAKINLAAALADFARVSAGYAPVNNPRPLAY